MPVCRPSSSNFSAPSRLTRAAQLPVPFSTPTLTQRLLDAGDVASALAADLERAARAAFAALL